MTDDASVNPLDQLLDYCVYAPLGFVLEARSLLPRLVERGRGQVVLAGVVGRYAVKRGGTAAEGALVNASEKAVGTLRRMGLVPDQAGDPLATPGPGVDVIDEGAASGPTSRTAEARPVPDIDPATLAIPDYDSLSASQVVPRLASLSADELQAVREYEQAARGRRTILSRIAQMQSG